MSEFFSEILRLSFTIRKHLLHTGQYLPKGGALFGVGDPAASHQVSKAVGASAGNGQSLQG